MAFAPIILFVYKRPEHTRNNLEALCANPEFRNSPFFVYCDGPKKDEDVTEVQRTRAVVRSFQLPNMVVKEQDINVGLSASIITGVTQVCAQFERAIVIEEDLVVSPHFLHYMNSALEKYQEMERVLQISGHTPPLQRNSPNDSFFLPFTTTWGWATWQRAWQSFQFNFDGLEKVISDPTLRRKFDLRGSYPFTKMAQDQRSGKQTKAWGICWYLKVYLQNGLVLFPRRSLVHCRGYDLKGTHSTLAGLIRNALINQESQQEFEKEPIQNFPDRLTVDEKDYLEVIRSIRASRWGKLAFVKWLK